MQESSKAALFDRIASKLLFVVVILSPLFFVPFLGFGAEISKTYFIGFGVLLALISWTVARMIEGRITFPKTPLMIMMVFLPMVFLLSAFFSPSWSVSLSGLFAGPGTVVGMTISALVFLGSALYFNTERRIHSLFGGMLVVTAFITLFQLAYLFIGAKYLNLGTFYTNVSNVVGKWNDLGVLYGLVLVVIMLAFQFMVLPRRTKILASIVGVFSFLFLVLINFSLLWAVIGFIALVIFIYSLIVLRKEENHTRFPVFPGAILVVSLFFFLAQSLVGGLVYRSSGLSQNEIRPSLVSTGHVIWETIKQHPVVGVGPDRFTNAWYTYQPKSIIRTQFSSMNFKAGSGFIPTLLVTTGIVGGIAFGAFLVLFVLVGILQMFRKITDSKIHLYLVSSFTTALFLWIIVFAYTPGVFVITATLAVSGLFVGVLNTSGRIPSFQIPFLKDPRRSFFAIVLLVTLLLGSLYTVFSGAEKFVSIAMYSRAQILVAKNDFSGATNLITKAVALYPADLYLRANTSLSLTRINELLGNTVLSKDILKSEFQSLFSAGETSAQQALIYDSTNPENWINLAGFYQGMIPIEINGAYANAKTALAQASKVSPSDPAIELLKAKLEVANKNNADAMVIIKDILERKPNYLEGIFFLAELEAADGDSATAIAQLEKVASADPRNYLVFLKLGVFKYDSADYTGAVSALERSITLNPTVSNTYYLLGLAYSKVGRVDESLQIFHSLQKSFPGNTTIVKIISNLEAGIPPLTGLEQSVPVPLSENTNTASQEIKPQTSKTPQKKASTQ